MANVLVTGGAGYVGSACAEQLVRAGHSVVIVDDLSTGFRDAVPAGAVFCQADIADRGLVSPLLKQTRFEAVFHFAAKALIPESVTHPAVFFEQNVATGIKFLELVREAGITRFVFSSSAAVYGVPERVPIDEDDPKQPSNSYGETKLMFERILRWYASAYNWSVVAMRYFNASGASQNSGERHDPETHIIPLLLQVAAGERDGFNIYGDDYETPDGTCIRDYVHVADIADAHFLALSSPADGEMRAYNIGCGQGYSVREVVGAVEDVTGKKIPLQNGPRRLGDPAVLCASPLKLMRELGWKPQRSDLKEIVRSAWEWKLAQQRASAHERQTAADHQAA